MHYDERIDPFSLPPRTAPTSGPRIPAADVPDWHGLFDPRGWVSEYGLVRMDGQQRAAPYASVTDPERGQRLLIVWRWEADVAVATETTPVVYTAEVRGSTG
jgi:hypothetical protein